MTKRIISVSYKDDTPAFHSEEFFESYRKGLALVDTKYGRKAVSLRPEDVHCFVFWTKNPSDHFIKHALTELQSPWYMQWTITGYDKDMEPNVPDKATVIERFKKASLAINPHKDRDDNEPLDPRRIWWRYDPVLISGKYTVEWHKAKFAEMCRALEGYTSRCVVSFLDEYGKISSLVRFGALRAPTTAEVHELARSFGETAARHGITIQTCSEGQYDLTAYGIHEAPCIDAAFIEEEFGITLPQDIKTPGSFRRCQCAVNTDIGAYHRCRHDCKYCYAK